MELWISVGSKVHGASGCLITANQIAACIFDLAKERCNLIDRLGLLSFFFNIYKLLINSAIALMSLVAGMRQDAFVIDFLLFNEGFAKLMRFILLLLFECKC